MTEKREFFRNYIAQKGLKLTRQREAILDEFLKSGAHLSTEELFMRVRRKYPHIGYATVYRTLKLFAECGLAEERDFRAGQTLYEARDADIHHDHLVCTRCGAILEFKDERSEKLQEQVAREHKFTMEDHRLEIFGRCERCSAAAD